MKYELIAVDLDGTLLNNQSEVSSRNAQALHRVEQLGAKVVISTGRMYCAAKNYAQQLGLKTPVICYQGAMVKDPVSDETLQEFPLQDPLKSQIIDELIAMGLNTQAYFDDRFFVAVRNEKTVSYEALTPRKGEAVGDLAAFVKTHTITKLIVNEEPEIIQKIIPYFQKKYGRGAQVVVCGPMFLSFTDPQADKGIALKWVAQYLGIDRSKVIAFGDQHNDISMLQYAGFGVAMGNAVEELKKAADAVTVENQQDGVAAVLEELF